MCVSRNCEPQGGPPASRSVVSLDLSGCRPAEVRQSGHQLEHAEVLDVRLTIGCRHVQ